MEHMSKKRRRLEIKVHPLPAQFQDETASCPVCGRDSAAIGRRHLQIVFRCDGCKVVFKRNRSWPYIYYLLVRPGPPCGGETVANQSHKPEPLPLGIYRHHDV